MAIFGKGAAALIPLLAAGGGGISGMRAEFERLNMTVSSADAGAAGEFGDKIEQVTMQIKGAMFGVAVTAINAISPFVPLVTNAIGAETGSVDSHRQFVTAAGSAAVGVPALGGTILAVSGTALAGSLIVGGLATAWATFGSVAAAMVSPPALAAASAGVVGFAMSVGAVEFLKFTGAGKKMASGITTAVAPLLAFFKEVFGGIVNAIAAGDVGLAGDIAMKGLEIAVGEGKDAVLNLWN